MRLSNLGYLLAITALALTACGPDDINDGQRVNLDTCLGVEPDTAAGAGEPRDGVTSFDVLEGEWPWVVAGATNAAYADGPVRLRAGAFTRTSPPEARMTVKVLGCQWADLDADGADEVAVLVSENFGGTGTFVSLHVLDTLNGETFGLAPVALGDRVFPYDFAVVGQVIRVGMLSHTADDPLCCPTEEQTRRFRVRNFQVMPTQVARPD